MYPSKEEIRAVVNSFHGRPLNVLDGPYASPSMLTEPDFDLIRQGKHPRLWEKLGAHPVILPKVEGVHFAVWAPNAKRVSVVGDFNDWDGRRHPMHKHAEYGIWEIFLPSVKLGQHYKYEIETYDNHLFLKTDPFAFQVEVPPKTASKIHDLNSYQWRDSKWLTNRKKWNYLNQPISIYEMHFGSWKRIPEQGNRSLSYQEMAVQLASYLQEMGFTHVEILPLTEHPFYGSWGYQTIHFFAPTGRYGSPDELKHFIDIMHQNGIGVILDWVPAHFPSDGYGLARFDGSHLFEHPDPRLGTHPEWKTLVFNYGRKEVVNFLLASALFWLEEYHFDGLRVDAVASLLYLDYARKRGQWVPNRNGGRENLEAVDFLKHLNTTIHQEYPGVITIAEESSAWRGVSQPVEQGGLGFDMKWKMGFMHDTLNYFSQDPIKRKFHSHKLTFSMVYAYSENFMLAFSHDEVVHGKRSLINKMPGDEWKKRANVRALLGWMYGHPGKKTIFMGMEFGQWREWNHDSNLEWHLLKSAGHQGIQKWVRDLNYLYRNEKSLHQKDFSSEGFKWIDCQDSKNSVYSFIRFAENPEDFLIFVYNFTPIPRRKYRIGIPKNGQYVEVLNSDASVYGGSNVGNMGAVQSEPIAWHSFSQSISLTLPPLSVLVLRFN